MDPWRQHYDSLSNEKGNKVGIHGITGDTQIEDIIFWFVFLLPFILIGVVVVALTVGGQLDIGVQHSGNAAGFGLVDLGSIPSTPAKEIEWIIGQYGK